MTNKCRSVGPIRLKDVSGRAISDKSYRFAAIREFKYGCSREAEALKQLLGKAAFVFESCAESTAADNVIALAPQGILRLAASSSDILEQDAAISACVAY